MCLSIDDYKENEKKTKELRFKQKRSMKKKL